MEYPEIDEIYMFYCYKTTLSFSEDGRTIDDSFPITTKYSMGKVFIDSSDTLQSINKNENATINSMIGPIISEIIIDDGGGGIVNNSFENAYNLAPNTSKNEVLYAILLAH